MRKVALALVLIFTILLWGCEAKVAPKAEVYVPSRWGTMEYVKEIRYVWFVKSEEVDFDNFPQLRKVVERIWEADRDGKSREEINKAFETRKLQDVLDNGV